MPLFNFPSRVALPVRFATMVVALGCLSVFSNVHADTSAARGASVFQQNCSACHQAQGQGLPGAFPPLQGHAVDMYKITDGRRYLTHVLLYGLNGKIEVAGQTYNGAMPPWAGTLSHRQIADVLNYVLTAWGNKASLPADFKPYTVKEIAAQAKAKQNGDDVYALREKLSGTKSKSVAGSGAGAADRAAHMKLDVPLHTAVPAPVYVALQNSNDIGVLPTKSTWQGANSAHYVALSADGSMLMASGLKTGAVYVFNTATGKLRGSIHLDDVVQGVKIAPNGKLGIAIGAKHGVAVVIDLRRVKIVKKIPVGKTPHNARFSADGKTAYVTLQGAGAIAVLDMKTLTKVKDIATPGLATPHNLDLSDNGKRMWIRDFTGHVGVLNLVDGKMLKVIKVGNGHGGIDVIPGGRYVATGAIADHIVSIIDQKSMKVVKNIDVGNGPHGVRASANGRWLYASMTVDNNIAVINMHTLKLAGQIPAPGKFPFWLAVKGND